MGTTFTVRLPRPQTVSLDGGLPEVQREAVRNMRILLVDDDALVLETYEEGLSLKGHHVSVAHNGREALAKLKSGLFDVMVTDLSMSGMAGLELAEKAKELESTLPIILLSGWAIQHTEKQIKQVGVDYVLPKPCSIEALEDTIREATRVKVLSTVG
ncbi:MAG: response regulator [Acidobacteria bacterium]|nr:response regulator [Acidobacteriota bacterium]NIQ29368.1 response regulator [Acidobacteriota bacterium]